MEIDKINADQIKGAQEFVDQYNELLSSKELKISIDASKHEDVILATLSLLRGKTEDEHHILFRGLCLLIDKTAGDDKEDLRTFLGEIQQNVFILGETVAGVDWH